MRLMELCRRSSRLTGAARTELTSGRSRSSSSSISWKRPPSLSQNPRSLLGSLALQLIQVLLSPCLGVSSSVPTGPSVPGSLITFYKRGSRQGQQNLWWFWKYQIHIKHRMLKIYNFQMKIHRVRKCTAFCGLFQHSKKMVSEEDRKDSDLII